MMIKILFKSCVGLVMIYEIEKYFQNCMSQIRNFYIKVLLLPHIRITLKEHTYIR